MTAHAKNADEIRDRVLRLLSDDEIARVRAGKTDIRLADGDEYIDLAYSMHEPRLAGPT
jgi:hypothetical protein